MNDFVPASFKVHVHMVIVFHSYRFMDKKLSCKYRNIGFFEYNPDFSHAFVQHEIR